MYLYSYIHWTASDFERLDPRLLRSFLAVVKTRSFSAAADAAALTQGAVSQQIAKLEHRLNAQLFVRAGPRVVLTPAGQLLAQYANNYLEQITVFLETLNEEFESIRGSVSCAMPESGIYTPYFLCLLERKLAFPELSLKIDILPSAEVLRELRHANINFGFINCAANGKDIQCHAFCFEEYVFVQSGGAAEIPAPRNAQELLALPMIVYPDMMDCLDCWIAAHFKDRGQQLPVSPALLRKHGEFSDMRGALAMVEANLGVTVVPRHVVAPRIAAGRIKVLRAADGKELTARQQISIVHLKGQRLPARVKRIIEWFLEMRTEQLPPETFADA